MVANLCGNTADDITIESGNVIRFEFKSDHIEQKEGFVAKYTLSGEDQCKSNGTKTFPVFIQLYSRNNII